MATVLSGIAFLCQATTYYISPNGNDSDQGTSPSTAWRTIGRYQQIMYSLSPGDQVLFERGGIYPGIVGIGSSGTSSLPIVIGAYGTGEKPIISGGEPVTNWIQHSAGIWRAALSTAPKYVIVNNTPITEARFPNAGFIRNEQGTNTQIGCSQLTQGSGAWIGAKVHIRCTNWSYETASVTSSGNGTITFTPITTHLGSLDWGFFLSGKLSQLDVPGEWAWEDGQLYLWAPGNADPNGLSVLASIHNKGVVPHWQQQHIRIENLTIQGQTSTALSNDGANNVVVTGCEMRFCYLGLQSSGNNNQYINNEIHHTFGSAMSVYDAGVLIENNTLLDIAMIAGMGEDQWGSWGVRTTGINAVVRNNRFTNIGYMAIDVKNNAVVERNVIVNATATLNDGAGISFDECNGALIQDNVVRDCIGNMESVAADHHDNYYIVMGIYFGNTSIKNTIVQRNTVVRCNGSGIHVDHTMVSTGNQVKDNTLMDNRVQLSLSDYSNYNGPGAIAPFHVPAYNGVYTGNIMYSIRPDQLCLRQYQVYAPAHVDFGTFNDNSYFSPYDELSIMIHNFHGGQPRYYTLERWQAVFGEDIGSTRSPLRSTSYTTVNELSGDLMVNGDFLSPVNDWVIWPTNGQVSVDTTYLDGGALKANLPNTLQYPSLYIRSPDQFDIQSGEWYRMRLSVQSDLHGIFTASLKGAMQLNSGNTMNDRRLPFSPERRDLEFYFQANATDLAAVMFSNEFVFQRYWIDNIQLHRVSVQELDPIADHVLFVNELPVAGQFAVPVGCWYDLNGEMVTGDLTIASYSSQIIHRMDLEACDVPSVAYTVGARVMLGGAMLSTGTMRTDLRSQALLPVTEPYTSLGSIIDNNGQQISNSVLADTGSQAVVDWVLLELRHADTAFSVASRMAALVRANGDVIASNGDTLITFQVPVQGKHLAVQHRNHLGIMTADPIAANGQIIDLTVEGTSTHGTSAQMELGNLQALWPGDVNGDGKVSYMDADNDRDAILMAVDPAIPSISHPGYSRTDTNLDGHTKFAGENNDRDVILRSLAGTITAVRAGQLP